MPSKKKISRLAQELAVVFLGVVLALAGENTLYYFSQRRSEIQYLNNLLGELRISSRIYSNDRIRYHQIDSAAFVLVNYPENKSKTENITPCRLVQLVQQLVQPDIYMSTYQDLISSGNITLISNRELRQSIISFYQRELYEERWTTEVKNNLSKPFDQWMVDLLTVEEFGGQSPCDSGRLSKVLKEERLIGNLNRTRKMAIQCGADLDERIIRLKHLIDAIESELSDR